MLVQTERLTLRPFEESDEEEAVRLFTDPEFMVEAIEPVLTLETAMTRLNGYLRNQQTRGYSKWAVRWTGRPEIIGYCGYGVLPLDGRDVPELAYRLMPNARGSGVATEAAAAMIGWGFEQLGLEVIHAIVREDNAPSRRVLGKLGFAYIRDVEVEGEPWRLCLLDKV